MFFVSHSKCSRALLPIVVVGCLAFVCSACRTPQGAGADSLAAVQIQTPDPMVIARALSQVFRDAGFQPMPVPPNRGRDLRMIFEKEGTTRDTVLYGDWSFKSLWYRAKIRINAHQRETADNYLVTCDVFRVRERGDRNFEEEDRLRSAKRGYFQELLEKAKAEAGKTGEIPAP